jgi:hypothetical protein
MSEFTDEIPTELPLDERKRRFREQAAGLRPITALAAPWERHLQPSSAAAFAEPAPPTAGELATQALERRERRLRSCGPVDPDAAKVCAAALDSCPRVSGHIGSEAAAAAAERFVLEPRMRTLALLGAAGRGKSWAALWPLATPAVWADHGEGCWLPANEIRVPTWDEMRSRATGAKLLVLDDLGLEANDWAAREACQLVESRHNRGARTIVTSNLPMQVADVPEASRASWKGRCIADRYGDRFVSRLLDAQVSVVVRCMGPDLRKTAR